VALEPAKQRVTWLSFPTETGTSSSLPRLPRENCKDSRDLVYCVPIIVTLTWRHLNKACCLVITTCCAWLSFAEYIYILSKRKSCTWRWHKPIGLCQRPHVVSSHSGVRPVHSTVEDHCILDSGDVMLSVRLSASLTSYTQWSQVYAQHFSLVTAADFVAVLQSWHSYQSWCKFAENNIVIIIVVYIGSGNFATKQQLSM